MRRRGEAASRAPEAGEQPKERVDPSTAKYRAGVRYPSQMRKTDGKPWGSPGGKPGARKSVPQNHPAVKVGIGEGRPVEVLAREADLIVLATRLKLEGHLTYSQIGERLKISSMEVARLVRKGLEDYRRSRRELVADEYSEALAQLARLARAWDKAAHGWVEEKDEIDKVTGEKVRVVYAADHKAAEIYRKTIESRMRLLGIADAKIQVEHTGPAGGPILHAHLDFSKMTDEQIARIRAAKSESDVAGLLAAQGVGGGGAP